MLDLCQSAITPFPNPLLLLCCFHGSDSHILFHSVCSLGGTPNCDGHIFHSAYSLLSVAHFSVSTHTHLAIIEMLHSIVHENGGRWGSGDVIPDCRWQTLCFVRMGGIGFKCKGTFARQELLTTSWSGLLATWCLIKFANSNIRWARIIHYKEKHRDIES